MFWYFIRASLTAVFLVTSSPLLAKTNYFYIHGLNSNIKSKSYAPFFEKLKTRGALLTPQLPGHQKLSSLEDLNPKNTKIFFQHFINKLTKKSKIEETTIIAHSLGAILFRNNIPNNIRAKFQKIIYLSPGAPPKHYNFFKFITAFIPSNFPISSYSPKNLRLFHAICPITCVQQEWCVFPR